MPRSTRLTLTRLLTKNPAAASSIIDSAICAVASTIRNRLAPRAPDGWPAWFFKVDTRSGRVLCSAGKRPNSRPVPMVSPPAKSSAGGLIENAIVCAASAGISDMMRRSVQCATSSPASPPNAASSSDSISSCPIRRARPAPSDRRMAISLARAADRASSRLAMFAQAISSTNPVTLRRSSSGVFATVRVELWPRPPGSTTIVLSRNLASV